MRFAALLVSLAFFVPPTAAQSPPGTSVSCGPSVLCVEDGVSESAAAQKEARRPSFGRLLGAGALGAAAGTGVLLLAAEAIDAELDDNDDVFGAEQDDEAALILVYLLPWIGSTTAVLAVGGDEMPGTQMVIVVAGSSFFSSLLGAGLAYAATRSGTGAVIGFAAGAGAGAALGYQAAQQNGLHRTSMSGLVHRSAGTWSLGMPSVRRVESGLPQRAPLRLVSLVSARL